MVRSGKIQLDVQYDHFGWVTFLEKSLWEPATGSRRWMLKKIPLMLSGEFRLRYW